MNKEQKTGYSARAFAGSAAIEYTAGQCAKAAATLLRKRKKKKGAKNEHRRT